METLVGLMVLGLLFALLAKWASNDGETMHCGDCQQNVTTEKDFSWPVFLVLLVVGVGVGGFVYALYFTWVKDPQCPVCGGDYLGNPHRQQQTQNQTQN